VIKNRLIAVLLVNNGVVVQTRKFKRTNMVGSAFTAVDFFNSWAIDEIVVLEISNNASYIDQFVEIISGLSKRCFVPLTVGGKIDNLELAHRYIRAGADKVVINTGAVRNSSLISEITARYGSQCVVISIDAAEHSDGPSEQRVSIDNARETTEWKVLDWARHAVQMGAGELLINSVSQDGNKEGYDVVLIREVSSAINVPVIAMGGVGRWAHLVDGIREGGAMAAAAGNIFHYTEHSTKKAKEYMIEQGLPMRPTTFYKVNAPRKVRYNPFQ
jgi:imidazole glycerol-phosphate synthase subunit HisF